MIYVLLQIVTGILVYQVLLREDVTVSAYIYAAANICICFLFMIVDADVRTMFLIPVVAGITLCDHEKYIIPDIFSMLIALNRIIYLDDFESFIPSLLDATVIFLSIYLLSCIMKKITHREAMGGGDMKLLFVLSLYLDLYRNIISIMISCLGGMIFMIIKGTDRIAFGPFISIAYLVMIVSCNF